ncbi:MAG: bacillithiol biosynthesis deacetylase BshB1 [Bacteroidota bacterium]
MKVDLLAIGAHPDDIELSCSGTLLHHIALGKHVALVDLTRGELGSRGSAEIRDVEAARAAEMMGAQSRDNLRLADGFFTHQRDNLIAVARKVRQYRPEIVLANAIRDRHPDHGRAAKLIADACFIAGLVKVDIRDATGAVLPPHRPRALYHYIQDYNIEPDFVVDISPYIEQKEALILAFRTQFYTDDPRVAADAPQTPISGKDFLDFLRARARTYGRHAGFEYAEGFTVSRKMGVRNLFDLA